MREIELIAEHQLENIRTTIEDAEKLHRAGKVILIRKLRGGQLRYLHKLFVPEKYDYIVNAIGFAPPSGYKEFFEYSNGAILFDNTLFIYGIIDQFSRKVTIEKIVPISLTERAAISSNWPEWAEVASLSGYSRTYTIDVAANGRSRLKYNHTVLSERVTFLHLLCELIDILENIISESGMDDVSARRLEVELEKLN